VTKRMMRNWGCGQVDQQSVGGGRRITGPKALKGNQIPAIRQQEARGAMALFEPGRLFVEGFGHEVAVMIEEASTAVEFDGGVAVIDLEVKEIGIVLAGGGLGKVKEMRANSLSAMGRLDEEFVNPRAFATVFEAVVETGHQIADQRRLFTDKVNDAVRSILQKLGEIRANRRFVKGL
jgi:hypothetical protein